MAVSQVIVAAATPWGRGALSVVRLSGRGLEPVLRGFVEPRSGWPVPVARPRRIDVFDADGTFDDGVLLLAAEGRSYTGEPTAELSLHGNPLVVDRAVRAAVGAGARLARPGEFTRRAVLLGKLDLVEAEAVLQVAQAQSAAGLEVARAGLDGRLGAVLSALRDAMIDVAAQLEARIDHPEADLEHGSPEALVSTLRELAERARTLAGQQRAGHALVHGVRVALIGTVNAGKSSIFNALCGEERALVHDTPGTTRDVVEARIVCDGLPITLLDTAGERVTADPVEQAGLALGSRAAAGADVRIVVLRARPSGLSEVERALLERVRDLPHVVVYNGVDRPGCAPVPQGALPTVAIRGEGVEAIVPALRRKVWRGVPREAAPLLASARQRDALLAVAGGLDRAAEGLILAGPTVAAEEVIEALEALDAVGGTSAREAVLDALFSRFCIGK